MTSEELAAAYPAAMAEVVKERKSPDENMMIIEVGYSNKIIFRHSDGMKFLDAIKSAESLVEDYNRPPRIDPVERNKFTVNILSSHEYNQIKMATLLGCNLNDIKDAEKACREATYQSK